MYSYITDFILYESESTKKYAIMNIIKGMKLYK